MELPQPGATTPPPKKYACSSWDTCSDVFGGISVVSAAMQMYWVPLKINVCFTSQETPRGCFDEPDTDRSTAAYGSGGWQYARLDVSVSAAECARCVKQSACHTPASAHYIWAWALNVCGCCCRRDRWELFGACGCSSRNGSSLGACQGPAAIATATGAKWWYHAGFEASGDYNGRFVVVDGWKKQYHCKPFEVYIGGVKCSCMALVTDDKKEAGPLFGGRTFVFFGFDTNDEAELTLYVEENGGSLPYSPLKLNVIFLKDGPCLALNIVVMLCISRQSFTAHNTLCAGLCCGASLWLWSDHNCHWGCHQCLAGGLTLNAFGLRSQNFASASQIWRPRSEGPGYAVSGAG